MVTYDNKNISRYEVGFSEKKNKKYIWHPEDLKNYSDELIHAIYLEENGTTWLGGVNYIYI